jgi:hypothetical protein
MSPMCVSQFDFVVCAGHSPYDCVRKPTGSLDYFLFLSGRDKCCGPAAMIQFRKVNPFFRTRNLYFLHGEVSRDSNRFILPPVV